MGTTCIMMELDKVNMGVYKVYMGVYKKKVFPWRKNYTVTEYSVILLCKKAA